MEHACVFVLELSIEHFVSHFCEEEQLETPGQTSNRYRQPHLVFGYFHDVSNPEKQTHRFYGQKRDFELSLDQDLFQTFAYSCEPQRQTPSGTVDVDGQTKIAGRLEHHHLSGRRHPRSYCSENGRFQTRCFRDGAKKQCVHFSADLAIALQIVVRTAKHQRFCAPWYLQSVCAPRNITRSIDAARS